MWSENFSLPSCSCAVHGRFRTVKPFSLIFSLFLSAMAAPLEEFIDFSEINSVQKCLAFLDDENSPTHTRSVQPGFQNWCGQLNWQRLTEWTENKERTETCARIDAQKPKEKCEGLLARLQGQLQIVLCESKQFSSILKQLRQIEYQVAERSVENPVIGLRYTTDGMTKQATNCSAGCAGPLCFCDFWQWRFWVSRIVTVARIWQRNWRKTRWCHRCHHSRSEALMEAECLVERL